MHDPEDFWFGFFDEPTPRPDYADDSWEDEFDDWEDNYSSDYDDYQD